MVVGATIAGQAPPSSTKRSTYPARPRRPTRGSTSRPSLRIAHVRLVRRVEEEDGAVGARVVDPRRELGARHDGARRVVGRAEVDEVGCGSRRVGDRGQEAVLLGAFEVGETLVPAVRTGGAGVPEHHVGVDIRGVDRIGHGDAASRGEDLEDVAAIALGAVREEDLVVGDRDAARAEVSLGDGGADRRVAGAGTVALEGRAVGELGGRRLHRAHGARRQRLGHIADPAADDPAREVGPLGGEGRDAARDLGEEVAGGELQVVLVDECHGGSGGGTGRGVAGHPRIAEGGREGANVR